MLCRIWDLDGTPLGIGAWNWRKHKEPFGVWYYYGLTGQRERWSSNNSQQQYLVSLDKVFLWIGMKTLDWIVKTSRGYTRSDIVIFLFSQKSRNCAAADN